MRFIKIVAAVAMMATASVAHAGNPTNAGVSDQVLITPTQTTGATGSLGGRGALIGGAALLLLIGLAASSSGGS